jgi:hypothetical protein
VEFFFQLAFLECCKVLVSLIVAYRYKNAPGGLIGCW